MGEAKRRSNVAVRGAVEALAVDTVGGRVQVRWNTNRAATPFGEWIKPGASYAAFSSTCSSVFIPGNHRQKVFRKSLFRTCTRVCSNK